jgi:hypothetical protein
MMSQPRLITELIKAGYEPDFYTAAGDPGFYYQSQYSKSKQASIIFYSDLNSTHIADIIKSLKDNGVFPTKGVNDITKHMKKLKL